LEFNALEIDLTLRDNFFTFIDSGVNLRRLINDVEDGLSSSLGLTD
jgi:hypothetical protein